MSCYFVAQIQIRDMEEYEKYLERVDEVFEQFHGKYLAVDKAPVVLEGNWTYNRTVLIEFPNEEEFRCWYESPQYQEILKHRLNAAKCDSLFVHGLD